jgi:hypothetical protein
MGGLSEAVVEPRIGGWLLGVEVAAPLTNVGYREQTGKHLLGPSLSHFDPAADVPHVQVSLLMVEIEGRFAALAVFRCPHGRS